LMATFPLASSPVTCKLSSSCCSPHSCFMSCPGHPPSLEHFTYTWRRITSYTAPRYAASSNLPSFYPSWVQIFSAAPCSQTPSVYIIAPISETKYRTHAKNHRQNYRLVYSNFLVFHQQTRKEGSGSSGNKHCQNSVSSLFPPESNFDMLLSFPNIWNVSYFLMICLIFLCSSFTLHSGDKTETRTQFPLCLFVDHAPY
jgi:hypothetical protein